MSRRLTDEELREPDVTFQILYPKFEDLPDEVRKHLELYLPQERGGALIYTVPAYLAREWGAIPAMAAPAAASSPAAAIADRGSSQAPHWQQMSLF